MSSPARLRTLYEYIESLPGGCRGEIVDGQLHVSSRPAARHVRVGSRFGSSLETPFDEGAGGPGGWWILDGPEVHFVLDVELAVPDIAGRRRERMPDLPDDQRFGVVPDRVCEILSPRTAAFDRGDQSATYARFGVSHLWMVDPKLPIVEAFANEARAGRAMPPRSPCPSSPRSSRRPSTAWPRTTRAGS